MKVRIKTPVLPPASVDPQPAVSWPEYEVERILPGKVYLDTVITWRTRWVPWR